MLGGRYGCADSSSFGAARLPCGLTGEERKTDDGERNDHRLHGGTPLATGEPARHHAAARWHARWWGTPPRGPTQSTPVELSGSMQNRAPFANAPARANRTKDRECGRTNPWRREFREVRRAAT